MKKGPSFIGKSSFDWLLALGGGVLLVGMISLNSQLAKHSSPIYASWVAHGLGAVAAFFIIGSYSVFFRSKRVKPPLKGLPKPIWAYFGGIPGAFTVLLAAITVNSRLALSGTVALMLVGQVFFGMFLDKFGLFGSPKRKLSSSDAWVSLSILSGSWILIFFGR